MAAYALDGLFTAWDIYELVRTLNDPCPNETDVALAGGGLIAGLFLPGGGLGTAAKALVKSGRKASKTTKLYRAVTEAELADLATTSGAFRNPFGTESKYFATSAEGAASYSRLAHQQRGSVYQGPYTIVETEIPSLAIRPEMLVPHGVDGGIATVVVWSEDLPLLSPAVPWNYMPIP